LGKDDSNLKAVIDNLPIGMVTLNEAGEVSQVNTAALAIMGKEYCDVIGSSIGAGLGCKVSIENKSCCGHSNACRCCKLRKAFDLALNTGQASSNIEFSKLLSKTELKALAGLG